MAVVKYFTLPVYLPNVFSIDLFRDGINELKSTYSLAQSHTWSSEITKSLQTVIFRNYSSEIIF